MSIKKELIKTFKNLLGVHFGKVYEESEIKISAKEVGGKVELVAADGTLSPAPDDDYVMADGFSFKVKDGVIESIVGEEKPKEEAPTEEVKAEETPSEEAPVEDDKTEARIAALEEAVAALQEALKESQVAKEEAFKKETETIENFNKELNALNDVIKTILKAPVETSKINKSNAIVDRKLEQEFSISQFLINRK